MRRPSAWFVRDVAAYHYGTKNTVVSSGLGPISEPCVNCWKIKDSFSRIRPCSRWFGQVRMQSWKAVAVCAA